MAENTSIEVAKEAARGTGQVAPRRRYYGETPGVQQLIPPRPTTVSVSAEMAMSPDQRALHAELAEAEARLLPQIKPIADDQLDETEAIAQPRWMRPAREYVEKVALAYLRFFLQPDVKEPKLVIIGFEKACNSFITNAWLRHFRVLAAKWNSTSAEPPDYLGDIGSSDLAHPSEIGAISTTPIFDEHSFRALVSTEKLAAAIAAGTHEFWLKVVKRHKSVLDHAPPLNAHLINGWMDEKGYTNKSLALELHLGQRAVSSMRNGRNFHGRKAVRKLANLMGRDEEDLYLD